MLRPIDYIILFIVTVLLQLLLFDNIEVTGLLSIFVYPLLVIVLPVSVAPGALLLLAALMGVTIDFFSGTAGLSTMSIVLMAFVRPAVLRFMVGDATDSAPVSGKIGSYRFLRYATVMLLVHNIAFFMLESLSLEHLPITLLRIAVCTVFSLAAVYFCQLPLTRQKERF